MPTDNEAAIAANALKPKHVSGDAGSVDQHPIPDQIEADKYLEKKFQSAFTGLGIKLFRMLCWSHK
jgi:hypothetical protein